MLISIITINFNNKDGLIETINSILKQEFQDFEHIIIDGDSTDGSKTIIEEHKLNFGYWVSEKDSGIYNAMNKGIKASKGKYLLFLNSGDTLNGNLILTDVAKYFKTNKDIYYGNLELVYPDYKELKEYPNKLNFNYFYNKGHIPHPSSFIKRTLFNEVYLYREDFKIVSDWDFFVCALCKHNASYEHIDIVVSNYDTEGISANPEYALLSKKERRISLEDNFPLFLDEAERVVNYDKKFKLNRFKLLDALEEKATAQKMNSVWLTLMAKVFKKSKK